jgi:tRNA-binding protein
MLINFHIPYYSMATFQDFQKLDIRVGRIIEVEDFPEARAPSYKLKIDLGKDIGIKKSCAQLVKNYTKEQLKGRLVLCVANFPPKQIGPAVSEVLTLGVPDENGECILIAPGKEVPLGVKLY